LRFARIAEVGVAMAENHELLRSLSVSTEALDRLADAARQAGALGAKLTGAGMGGNVIALLGDAEPTPVLEALREAGARAVLLAEVAC
jgi:mevalonate kinase